MSDVTYLPSILRAMAKNYAGGHRWDHLDSEAVTKAADHIATLEAENAKLHAGQEPVAYTTAGMLAIAKELPRTGRIGARCKADDRWNVPLYTTPQPSAVPEYTSAMGEAAQQYIDECCRGSDGQLLITPPRMPGTFFWYELYARMLAAQTATARVQGDALRPLYTCIGKGGEYRYLGTAIGAGDSRGELVEVYQDRTGQLFHRTPEDFMERMEPIAAARQEGGK